MFSEPNDIQRKLIFRIIYQIEMENKAKKLSDDGKYLRAIAIISQGKFNFETNFLVVATKKSQESKDLNEYATKMAQVFN